jgi:long-chain acyl-CoA synthetase
MYSERVAMVYGDRQTTYGDFHDLVARTAGALVDLDSRRGASVGILSANCDRAIVAFHGAIWAGMVPNYLNVRWSAHELGQSIDDFAPSILVVDDNYLDMGLDLLGRCATVTTLVHIGERQDLPEGVLRHSDLLVQAPLLEDRSGDADDMVFLNYTGGTTGKGKGVMHSHATHATGLSVAIAEGFFQPGNTLVVMPLFHIGGISITNAGLMMGSTLYIVPAFDPAQILNLIQDQRIVHALMVPTMWQMLLQYSRFDEYDLSSLKFLRYGASPIDETLLMALRDKLPGVDFMQIYGQTEGVPATLLHDVDHGPEGVAAGRTRSAGTPCFSVEIEIRDDGGQRLPNGEIGEICIRAPYLMLGYLNLPEQTQAALQGSWLCTGDAGYFTDDGYLFVVDRIKDMIVTGGENVYSVEVESVIYQIEGVDQCAIVGLPDEKWGEKVHAEVVLKAGFSLTEDELIAHCREYLAGYKLPRSVALVDALPLTAVGKVDKVAIRDRHHG